MFEAYCPSQTLPKDMDCNQCGTWKHDPGLKLWCSTMWINQTTLAISKDIFSVFYLHVILVSVFIMHNIFCKNVLLDATWGIGQCIACTLFWGVLRMFWEGVDPNVPTDNRTLMVRWPFSGLLKHRLHLKFIVNIWSLLSLSNTSKG